MSVEQKNIAILLLAAGRGRRAGAGLPKQYRMLGGEILLARTLKALREALPNAFVQAVIHPDDLRLYQKIAEDFKAHDKARLLPPAFGGEERQASAFEGLKALEAYKPDWVFIHDGARPFVTKSLVERLLAALNDGALGAIPALDLTDSVKLKTPKGLENIEREKLARVQTPQAFCFKPLYEAHEKYQGHALSDDASLFDAGRLEPGVTTSAKITAPNQPDIRLVLGDENNIKFTHMDDFARYEQTKGAELGDIRVGSGFDVHRFMAGDHVWLGGVEIAHSYGLKGHSDADVALHAVTDALLSAIGDGDIGQHFPPSDPQWHGASSDRFLAFAAERIRQKKGMIAHIALTILCESPKIGPHRTQIEQRIADILKIDKDRVAVGATTTEKLGFLGRGEGIAAQATATVRLPF